MGNIAGDIILTRGRSVQVETAADKARFRYGYRRSPDQDAGAAARHPVIVVGAGPVGLTAAIDLALRGVPVVILDESDRIGEGSRGICCPKRTREVWGRP